MPNNAIIPPNLFMKIVFVGVGQGVCTEALQLTGQIVTGILTQGASYLGAVVTSYPLEPMKLLPPIISYSHATYDYIAQATGYTRCERVAILAFGYTAAGLFASTGDTPFLYSCPLRGRKFSAKHTIQHELIISGGILIILTTVLVIIPKLVEKIIQVPGKIRTKRSFKSLKFNRIKSKAKKQLQKLKIFRPKPR